MCIKILNSIDIFAWEEQRLSFFSFRNPVNQVIYIPFTADFLAIYSLK
jgi:hypothetical protein